MEKCDLCLDRWDEGKRPICVDSCPARALDADLLEDLAKKYRTTTEADGFTHSARLRPSILFRSKKPSSQERES
jgi:anaerobic dimethyl sulfoxide reductase subunit B (iron-sulfur subunit)